MKYILYFLIIIHFPKAQASFAEFFGASARSSSLANQFTADPSDASNNYFAPSLLAFSQRLNISMGTSLVNTDFKSISNVTIRNTATHTSTRVGSINTDYPSSYIGQIHLSLPLAIPKKLKLNVSVFAPLTFLQETNTGDAYLTEYIMYRARYRRVQSFVNLSYPLSQHFAVSVGTHVGVQIAADTYTVASTGGVLGSQSTAKAKASPALAALASVGYHDNQLAAYFSFQQELKQKLKTVVTGETTLPQTPLTFNNQMQSLLYYDPMLLRLGAAKKWDLLSLFISAEYQFWKNYQTSIMRNQKQGGIIEGSSDLEKLSMRNIFVPKFGAEFHPWKKLKLRAGMLFRPSPVKNNFSGPGNSVDTDSTVYSAGAGYGLKLMGHQLDFDGALQLHLLKDLQVKKSGSMENGAAGNKIGAPGYTVGGKVLAATLGMRMSF